MTGSTRTIRVKISQNPSGLFVASSPDLTNLDIIGESFNEVRNQAPRVITSIFMSMGQTVTVSESHLENIYVDFIVTPINVHN